MNRMFARPLTIRNESQNAGDKTDDVIGFA